MSNWIISLHLPLEKREFFPLVTKMPVVSKKGKIHRFLDLLNSVMAGIAATMVIFMMLAISYSVIMRYLFNRPIAWIVEISSYLMLYITFLGTAWLLRREGHVEIDLLTGRLSQKQRAVLRSVTSVGGATVGFVLTWKGVLITVDYFRRGVIAMDILNTPQYLLMAIIPIGGFLLMIEFILRIFRFNPPTPPSASSRTDFSKGG